MNGEKINMEKKELESAEKELNNMSPSEDTSSDNNKEVKKEERKLRITTKKLTFDEVIGFREQTYEFLSNNVDKLDILGDVYFKILFASYYTNLFDLLPSHGSDDFNVIYDYICDIDIDKMVKGCRGFARTQLHDIMKFYDEALNDAKEMEKDTISSLVYRIKNLIDIIEEQISGTDVSAIMKLLEEIPKTQAELEGSPIIMELVNALGLINDSTQDDEKDDDNNNDDGENKLLS